MTESFLVRRGASVSGRLAVLVVVSGCSLQPMSLAGPSDVLQVAEPSGADVVAIVDVDLFDGVQPQMQRSMDVLVEAGRILTVQPTGERLPPGAHIVDGTARTLIPGLVDAHAHTTLTAAPPWVLGLPDAEHNLRAHLRAGVTSVLDLGAIPSEALKARRGLREQGWEGPRVFFAGPLLTVDDGYPLAYIGRLYPWPVNTIIGSRLTRTLSTPHEAQTAIDENVRLGFDLVKVVVASTPLGAPHLEGAPLVRAVEEAHRRRRPTFAHVDQAEHAMVAADAGVRALAHGVHTSTLAPAQAARLAERGVAVIPTLLSLERLHQLVEGDVRFTELEKQTEPPDVLASFARAEIVAYEPDPALTEWLLHVEKHRGDSLANIGILRDAGVDILVGTDANGSPGCFPAGIHEEMRLLVEAGLSPVEVLLGATSKPARLARPDADFGFVARGARADLVLVEGDPLADITQTSAIIWVMKEGKIWSPRP